MFLLGCHLFPPLYFFLVTDEPIYLTTKSTKATKSFGYCAFLLRDLRVLLVILCLLFRPARAYRNSPKLQSPLCVFCVFAVKFFLPSVNLVAFVVKFFYLLFG